jgi:hypothetical protein
MRSLLALGIALVAGGCVVNAAVKNPTPNVLLSPKFAGTASVQVEGNTEPKMCSSANGAKDFCVSGFRAGFQKGLDDIMTRAMKPGDSAYRAVLRVVELQHTVDNVTEKAGTVKISLKWQFELFDPQGNPVVQLAERTEGPEKLTNIFQTDSAADALVASVLERVAAAINQAQVPTVEPVVASSGAAQPAAPGGDAAPVPATDAHTAPTPATEATASGAGSMAPAPATP